MTEEPTTGAMPQALVERLAAERARAQAAAQAAAADVEPPEPEPTPDEGAGERATVTLAEHSRDVATFARWIGGLAGRRMRADSEAAFALATLPAARRWGHLLADPPAGVCLGLLALGLAGLALEFGLIGPKRAVPAQAQPQPPAGQGGAQ